MCMRNAHVGSKLNQFNKMRRKDLNTQILKTFTQVYSLNAIYTYKSSNNILICFICYLWDSVGMKIAQDFKNMDLNL